MTYRTVAELLADESRWTQGQSARDASGEWVPPKHESAIRWCVLGAIDNIYGHADYWEKVRLLSDTIEADSVHHFNDTHTHAEVLAKVREAGI